MEFLAEVSAEGSSKAYEVQQLLAAKSGQLIAGHLTLAMENLLTGTIWSLTICHGARWTHHRHHNPIQFKAVLGYHYLEVVLGNTLASLGFTRFF